MVTRTTKLIQNQLTAIGESPAAFANTFDLWKQAGATGEYKSYLFGKDGAYVRPTVAGKQYVLMHVHLVPLRDQAKLKSWNRIWHFRGRKTSNRALVYVADKTYGYLLIAILDEPKAHQIAKMRTPADNATMLRLAKVAEAFLSSGQIIA